MTYASVASGLQELLTRVPNVQTVERSDQITLGQAGSVQPKQGDPDRPTPLLRLGRVRRPLAREVGWTIDGTRQVHQLIECELWAYADDVAQDADAFNALLEAAIRTVRQSRDLAGAADTATSRVLQVKVIEHMAPREPLGASGQQPLFHGAFRVDAWEAVW